MKLRNLSLAAIAISVIVNSSSTAFAVDVSKRSVALNMFEEPKELDPQKADDQISFMIINHTFEGLFRLDQKENPIPAVAEKWEVKSPTQFVFKLRKNALWSDGVPVKAQDFEYAWKRCVDPKTASQYGFIMFSLKNGKAINEGKVPVDQLGVKAIDDSTLSVELERPLAYFTRLLAFGTYTPARKDIVEKFPGKYVGEAQNAVYNGPFVIESWKHESSLKLVKNDKYWNKDKIMLNEINMPYLIRDLNSEFNMFKDGKFDIMWRINKEQIPDAQANKMKIERYTDGSDWWLEMNNANKYLSNKNIRKAIQLALNRTEYVNQVYGIPGSRPAYSIVPDYMPGMSKRYREEHPLSFKDGDVTSAKKYLAQGLKELGLKKLPELAILGTDSDEQKRDLEYLKRYYKEKMDIDFKIDLQTFKVRLERMDRKDFDLVWAGWGPDYLDVMTFADLWTKWNQNNHTSWSGPAADKYTAFIDSAITATDLKTRFQNIADAEKILVEEAPVAMIYQRYRTYVVNPQLVGVLRRVVGADIDFYYARVADTVSKK